MKLVVIDPGFEHVHSHHIAVNKSLSLDLSLHNVQVSIVASININADTIKYCLESGMVVTPYFSTPCYPSNASSLPRHQHELLAKLFSAEIQELFNSGYLVGNEVLLIHTLYSFHLAGFAHALWHLKDKFRGRLVVSMMFHPGARLIIEDGVKSIECFDSREFIRHKLAFTTLFSASKRGEFGVVVGAPCRSYRDIYQRICSDTIVNIHPFVAYREIRQTLFESKQTKTRVILYLGGAKSDKGIEFSALLGTVLAKTQPDVEFVFHFNNDFPGAEQWSGLINDLKESGKPNANVEIITGNLEVQAYDDLIISSHIVCILYDPSEYKFKTSGVFWDALRNPNISWVVSENTWVASELQELGLDHQTVRYGDLEHAADAFAVVLNKIQTKTQTVDNGSFVDIDYLRSISSSFGEWIYQSSLLQTTHLNYRSITKTSTDFVPKRARILIVRTSYGHFSPLSGPGGFIPYLRALGYDVDEWFVKLGGDDLSDLPISLVDKFRLLSSSFLKSYQGNSIKAETRVIRNIGSYDIVHFVDGEHSGLFTAIFKYLNPDLVNKSKIVSTFHQPISVLNHIVEDESFLNYFDAIHLMSPCQQKFFNTHVDPVKIQVIPHGVSPELLHKKLPVTVADPVSTKFASTLIEEFKGKKILLTVGNWLRDFNTLLATVEIFKSNPDIVFLIISKGLDIDVRFHSNVKVVNHGVSDSELHLIYQHSTLLFLPLIDGAANNAILEAMAHGLPIVTSDLPSTRFYTNGLAKVAETSADSYAEAIRFKLEMLGDVAMSLHESSQLKARAQELIWSKVSIQMHQKIYMPLINNSSR